MKHFQFFLIIELFHHKAIILIYFYEGHQQKYNLHQKKWKYLMCLLIKVNA